MFSAHKPLYFVFKNEGEVYFQDSMLQLELYDYLWLELHKSGYRHIYFVDSIADKVTLTILDGQSYDEYHRNIKLLFGKSEPYKKPVHLELDAPKAAKRILTLIGRNNGQTAFVFQNHAFADIFAVSSYNDLLGQLIKKQKNSRNPIVLVGSMEMDTQELEIYVNPDGVFGYQTGFGQCLCRELFEIIHSGEVFAVFDSLKEKIRDQFLELGTIEFAGITTLMRNIEFSRGELWKREDFDSYVNFLYWWIYKDELKRFCSGLFSSIKGQITYKAIFQAMQGNGMRSFLARVDRQREIYEAFHAEEFPEAQRHIPMVNILAEEYGPLPQQFTKNESHIRIAEAELEGLAETLWPAECYAEAESSFPIKQIEGADWEKMKKNLIKPRNVKINQSRLKWIDVFRQHLQKARYRNDHETAQRAVNALMYCGNNFYTADDYEKYCEGCLAYLNVSEAYFKKRLELSDLQKSEKIADKILQAHIKPLMASVIYMENSLQSADLNYIHVEAVSRQDSGKEVRKMMDVCLEKLSLEEENQEDYSIHGSGELLEKYANMH